MCKSKNNVMTPEEELVEVLLDFIIVSANLAKKVMRPYMSAWGRKLLLGE